MGWDADGCYEPVNLNPKPEAPDALTNLQI